MAQARRRGSPLLGPGPLDVGRRALDVGCLPRVQTELHHLHVRWLGRIGYAEALALQEEIVARKATDQEAADELLLLEHEPIFTIGRTQDQSSLREAAALPAPVTVINRGGQATWH